jgi:tetratricopeptide (TPR) repeat protein
MTPPAPFGAMTGPSMQSSSKVARLCDAVIRWTLLALAVLIPVFFLPWTIEVVELNKQLLLLVGAAVAGMAWLGKMLAERKFEYRRSIVNVMVLLFTASYALSTWLSDNRYMSVMGDFGQEKAGLVTLIALVVLYFVACNNLRTLKDVGRLMTAVMAGGFVAALYALLQGLGVYILPFAFAKSPSFNTVGTVAALGTYLAFIVTLAGGMLLTAQGHPDQNPKKKAALKAFYAVTAVISLLLIAVIDFWPITVTLLVSSALLLAFAFMHAQNIKSISGILLPIAALVVSVLILFFRFPVSLGYPAEVMPSYKASMDITMKTLREDPLLGSGPGTFLFDYAKYRAEEVNETPFWNIRFDRGASRFMTILATTGLIGGMTWLLVGLFLLGSAARRLFKTDEETWHALIGVFGAWAVLFLSKFLYSSTLTLEFAFWLMMAVLVVVHRKDFFSVKFENSPRAAMMVSFVFILTLVFTLAGLFVEGTRYGGEIAYAKAIRADRAGEPVDQVIQTLGRAAELNPRNDVYLRNLALALLVKADQEFANPAQVEKNEGEEDEDHQNRVQAARQEQLRAISQLTASAVNTAKAATDMNPSNVANWSVLASIYQSIMGVTEGADGWAVASYEKAIELEPSNPALHTELGKVYVYQSDVARQATDTKDEEAKKAAQARTDELLGKAVDAFNKAIELKSDYAPAHYNLALALDRQGKLKEAIGKMESVVQFNPQDVGVGFQLSLLYFRDGRKDDARALMESVVRLAPNFSNARWYLAAMYEENKELDKAIAEIEKVAELNPGNELVVRKLDELKKLKDAPPAPEGELPPPVEQPVTTQNQPEVNR